MHDDSMAVVKTARSPEEARVIVAVLESHGIPTFLAGQALQDEFALSQRLLNLSVLEIQVPASLLETAKLVLEEARRVGESFGEEDEGEGGE